MARFGNDRMNYCYERILELDAIAEAHWKELEIGTRYVTVEDLDTKAEELSAKWECSRKAVYNAKARLKEKIKLEQEVRINNVAA